MGCILQAVFTCYEYAKKPLPAVIFKGAASLCFVFLGVICLLVTKDGRFGALIAAGLAFGAVGDVLLGLRPLAGKAGEKAFILGMAAFLTGHVLYVAALVIRGVDALYIAVPLCAVSAVLIPFMLKKIDVAGKIRIFGIVYIIVVLFMTSCAIGHLILAPANAGYLLFAIGALLFTVSDLVLILHLFGRKKRKFYRALNLATYYTGQILIALNLLCI